MGLDRLSGLFSDLVNYDLEDTLEVTVHRVNELLGAEFFDVHGSLERHIEPFKDEVVEPAIDIVRQRIEEVRNLPVYNRALEAYFADDQNELLRLIPKIFPGLVTPKKTTEKLYHGISVTDNMDVKAYVDLALEILQEGLLPSPHGVHHSMDENLRPIYSAIHPAGTHGYLFFTFSPAQGGYSVFQPDGMPNERLVYTPKLKVPMELHLRSPKHLAYRVDGKITDPAKEKEFYRALEAELIKRGLGHLGAN